MDAVETARPPGPPWKSLRDSYSYAPLLEPRRRQPPTLFGSTPPARLRRDHLSEKGCQLNSEGYFDQLGDVLRKLRERKGLQQQEVAKKAGLSRAMMSRYESGKVHPQLKTLERILVALDIEPGEFFEALHKGSAAGQNNTFVFVFGGPPDPTDAPLVDTLKVVEGAVRRARKAQERRQAEANDDNATAEEADDDAPER